MVFGLGFYHVSLAMNNLTTLESMGGANMRTPCDSNITTEKKLVRILSFLLSDHILGQ